MIERSQSVHAAVDMVVDGESVSVRVEPRTSLADALREEAGVTSVRIGCEQGVCGSCTVAVDGVAQRSCLTFAVQADGASITTVAGIDALVGEVGEALRDALSRHFALQCGFCASGLVVTAAQWLSQQPSTDEDEVRRMLSGNICRCSGYDGMVRAIVEVAAGLEPQT